MSVYEPVNLGDVLQQAGAIKAQQQKGQMNDLALQEAQKQHADQEGIDTALTQNPNANLGDLIKAGGGMPGVEASQKVGAARTADLTNHYRQMYTAASQVANSDNPLATIQQVAPQFPQQYDQVHGPGAFAKLAQDPAALKQQAAQVAQDSLAGLVDPDKQFEAHQKMIEDHYKQESPGGEGARNAATIAAENQRNQFTQGQENARNRASIEAANARAGLNPDGTSTFGTGANTGLSGEAFLATLPQQQQAQVKALADGRMQFPGGFALKSPYWQQMITAVSQYDPNFDAVNYNARASTRKDFTSGKSAQNIKSLNTAIGHLGTLDSQIEGTASHSLTPVNYVQNMAAQLTGSSGPTQFTQTAGALASELTAVFRGTGGAEADVKRYLAELSPNASLEQKKAAVKNITELLASRTAAIGDQYNKGMGKTEDPLTLLDPRAASVLQHLSGGAPQAQTAHPAPVQALLDKYK